MIPQVLSHYRLPALACLGLLLFVGVFVGTLVWVFRSEARSFYSTLESLPLAEDSRNERGVRK